MEYTIGKYSFTLGHFTHLFTSVFRLKSINDINIVYFISCPTSLIQLFSIPITDDWLSYFLILDRTSALTAILLLAIKISLPQLFLIFSFISYKCRLPQPFISLYFIFMLYPRVCHAIFHSTLPTIYYSMLWWWWIDIASFALDSALSYSRCFSLYSLSASSDWDQYLSEICFFNLKMICCLKQSEGTGKTKCL